ncbi:MAG: hypothetical protein WC004_00380 [Candidatus Absconditabacterales bacterium]
MKKKIGKIVYGDEIQSLQKELLGHSFNMNKFYKLIYTLKNKGYLLELKNGTYIVSYPEAQASEQEERKESYYWLLLHEAIKKHCSSNYCISGAKGLEIYLNNYELPEIIEISNTKLTKKEIVLNKHEVHIKAYDELSSPANKKIRSTIKSKRTKVTIGGKSFFVAPLGFCMLETMHYTSKMHNGYETELVRKILKKYKNKIDLPLIATILKSGKHHTSVNRLYNISKGVDEKTSQELFELIKRSSFRISL